METEKAILYKLYLNNQYCWKGGKQRHHEAVIISNRLEQKHKKTLIFDRDLTRILAWGHHKVLIFYRGTIRISTIWKYTRLPLMGGVLLLLLLLGRCVWCRGLRVWTRWNFMVTAIIKKLLDIMIHLCVETRKVEKGADETRQLLAKQTRRARDIDNLFQKENIIRAGNLWQAVDIYLAQINVKSVNFDFLERFDIRCASCFLYCLEDWLKVFRYFVSVAKEVILVDFVIRTWYFNDTHNKFVMLVCHNNINLGSWISRFIVICLLNCAL